MEHDAQPAAPSAAPAPPPPVSFAQFEAERLSADRGLAPTEPAKPSTPPADSSPAAPDDQAASTEATETAPASETGQPRKRNADTRVQELLAERARERERAERAEQELAELRSGRQPKQEQRPEPESRPAPATAKPAAFPSYDDYLTEHPDVSYEDYIDARTEHRFNALQQQQAEQRARETRETEYTQSIKARDEQSSERLKTYIESDPELVKLPPAERAKAFFEGISDEVKSLRPFDAIRDAKGQWTEQPTAKHAVAEALLKSDVAPQLMRHFTDHPEDLANLYKLKEPDDLFRAFGKLEERIQRGASKPAAPRTVVTAAPDPGTILGTRPAAPADPEKAALARGDFRAFEAERIKRDLAAVRR